MEAKQKPPFEKPVIVQSACVYFEISSHFVNVIDFSSLARSLALPFFPRSLRLSRRLSFRFSRRKMTKASGTRVLSNNHVILMEELGRLEVNHALLSWIAALLTNWQQAVRIGGTSSDWKTLKGGVPQGTKPGVILFTVTTNKMLSDWRLSIKFVDDTSALEIIPRNSISLLNNAVSDINNSAVAHKKRRNVV